MSEPMHYVDFALEETRRSGDPDDAPLSPRRLLIDGRPVAVLRDSVVVDRVETGNDMLLVTCTFVARSFTAVPVSPELGAGGTER